MSNCVKYCKLNGSFSSSCSFVCSIYIWHFYFSNRITPSVLIFFVIISLFHLYLSKSFSILLKRRSSILISLVVLKHFTTDLVLFLNSDGYIFLFFQRCNQSVIWHKWCHILTVGTMQDRVNNYLLTLLNHWMMFKFDNLQLHVGRHGVSR